MNCDSIQLGKQRPPILSVLLWMIVSVTSFQVGYAQKQLDAEIGDRGILLNDLAVTHPISAWLNHWTVMSGEIDLSKVDVDAGFRWLEHMTSWNAPDALSIRGMQQTIRDARSERVYVLGGSSTLRGSNPIFVIPDDRDDVLGLLLQRLRPGELSVTRHKDSLMVASGTQVEFLQRMGTKLRPELVFPLRDGERLDHTLVVAMSSSMRNSFAKKLPEKSPPSLPVAVSPQELVLDVDQWIVSFQLPPEPVVRLTAKCVTPEAATRTHDAAVRLIKESEPSLSEIHLQRDGLRVVLSIDSVALEQLRPHIARYLKRAK